MAVKHYIGSTNNTLVNKLASVLSHEKSLFAPTFICIGHSSTKDWLVEELVQKMDILGNCVFQKQQELIQMIHATLIESNSKKELYQSDHLQWFIFSILRSDDFRTAFPEISSYYGDDALMQFTLAEKVTDLLEVYQASAMDVINALTNDSSESLHFKWQQYIWKELQRLTENKFASLPSIYREINDSLLSTERQEYLRAKIPNIHLYGDLDYNPEFIEFLKTIARHINVTLYRVSFSNEQNTSRFVKNNNAFSKNNTLLLKGIEAEFLSESLVKSTKTLLSCVQSEIENGNQENEYNYNTKDDSITISNCFTEYREVEALWNFLIHQFKNNETLALRDVCVIVPAIEKYAPAIKAVFNNEKVSLDYTFYDSNAKIQDSPYKALIALYGFDAEEFTSKQVFSLLEFKYIRDKFGFNEDLSLIKKAINDASILHGYEGQATLETQFVSWKNGLKRLIIGACVEKTDEQILGFGDAFYPLSEFEDQAIYELIRLNHFVDTLQRFSKEKNQERTLADWQIFIKNSIEEFINITEYEPAYFDKKLEQLAKSSVLISYELIPFNVIQYYLTKLFENQDVSERIGFGGIRFVSPNPRMVTSFKINCFLGLNGSDFPRSFKKLSFDLRNKEQITTSNDLDKHLFLSLIQGTKEKLYVSYIGQNVKDNSVIPASTLVEDLLAVCKKWKITKKELIHKHPLHAFSTKYNHPNFPGLIRYDSDVDTLSELHLDSNATIKEVLKRDPKGRIVIPLHELIRFMEDPVKHFYTKVLGIYYSDKSIDLSESELFDLGYLEQWNVKNTILQGELKRDLNEDTMYQRLKMNGHFPLKNLGERVKKSISTEAQKVVESIQSKINLDVQKSLPIYIELENKYVIEGNIDSIFENTFLFATVSSNKWKYQLRAAIQFLAVINSRYERISKGYYVSKNKTMNLNCTSENAKNYLMQLCAMYEDGSTNLNHFSIDFGDKLNENKMFEHEKTPEQFVDILENLVNGYMSTVHPSEYFMRELTNGSMTNQMAMDTFKTYFTTINELLTSTLS
jgi:exodeoxyribonuclease V gamma subunit